MKIVIGIIVGFTLLMLWLLREIKHAPTVDDNGNYVDEN